MWELCGVCELRWFDQKSYEWVWAGGHNALEEHLVTIDRGTGQELLCVSLLIPVLEIPDPKII